MSKTSIEWTDRTWNPTRGCSRVSDGCRHCYAEGIAARFSTHALQTGDEPGGTFAGFAVMTPSGPRWTGKVKLIESKLEEPLHWRNPCRVFVNSMSDLFHENLPFEDIDKVFTTMLAAPQHTYQILTKRPARMLEYFSSGRHDGGNGPDRANYHLDQNIWLGVSVENQSAADERIPVLLQTPAEVRFVSYEPALGPVDFDNVRKELRGESYMTFSALHAIGGLNKGFAIPGLDWLIIGGESGPGSRPFDIQWARNAIAQCKAAGVSCFVKQLGSYPFEQSARPNTVARNIAGVIDKIALELKDRKGGDMVEWPSDVRIREYPLGAGVEAIHG